MHEVRRDLRNFREEFREHRDEFRHVDAKKIIHYDAWYTQGGVQLTSKLSLNAVQSAIETLG